MSFKESLALKNHCLNRIAELQEKIIDIQDEIEQVNENLKSISLTYQEVVDNLDQLDYLKVSLDGHFYNHGRAVKIETDGEKIFYRWYSQHRSGDCEQHMILSNVSRRDDLRFYFR